MIADPASLPVRRMTHKERSARRAADQQVDSMIADALKEKDLDCLPIEPEGIPLKRCGKHIYFDKRHAQTAAKGLLRISPTGALRAYQCPICDGGVWHLSSKITHEEFRKRMKEQRDHRAACRRRAVLERLRLEDEE